VRQIIGILGIVAGLMIAARYAEPFAQSHFFDSVREHNPRLPKMAAYIAIFLAVALAAGILSAVISRMAPRRNKELRATDSFLGAVLGALQGVLLLGGISIGLLEWDDPRARAVKHSVLAPKLAEGCKALVLLIPQKGREEIREGYERGKEAVEEALPGERLRLNDDPGTHADPAPRHDAGPRPEAAPEKAPGK
jgi:uncharacterized membrane protein required for colicin V production